jgi:monofunctional biosynthetic peptidoglycan transglycosylase
LRGTILTVRPKPRRRPIARTLLRGVVVVVLVWVVVSVGAVLFVRVVDPPFTAVMLLEPGPLRDLEFDWVGRDRIAANAARAVIASEDQRFLAHHGIDFVSLDRAIEEYRDGDNLRGASTITQQVAKNLFLWQGRSVVRKGVEAYFALLIELCWTKRRILEVYLNVAELGPGVFGVQAASRRYFGTDAGSLDAAEAALLAAVLPNPKALSAARPSAYVRERQDWIEGQMRLLESRGHYRGIDW